MRKRVCFVLMALLANGAQAADRCYDDVAFRAERLLRLHSEAMVITVTCRQASSGQDLGRAYAAMTHHHIRPLHDAEETMIQYYKASFGGKGIDRLDTLRTKLANEYGQQSADDSAPVFCAQRRDKVIALNQMSTDEIEAEAIRAYEGAKTYAPLCGGVKRAATQSVAPSESPKKSVKRGAG